MCIVYMIWYDMIWYDMIWYSNQLELLGWVVDFVWVGKHTIEVVHGLYKPTYGGVLKYLLSSDSLWNKPSTNSGIPMTMDRNHISLRGTSSPFWDGQCWSRNMGTMFNQMMVWPPKKYATILRLKCLTILRLKYGFSDASTWWDPQSTDGIVAG